MNDERRQEIAQANSGVLAYIDRYSLQAAHEQQQQAVNVQREAALLKLLVGAAGVPKRLVAILNATDEQGIAAYKQTGFLVQTMNGDRPRILPQLLTDELIHLPVGQLIVVSADQVFLPFCASASQQNSRVVLWLPPGAAHLPTALPIEQRLLHEVLPPTYIKADNIFAWLDIENLLGAINKPAMQIDIAKLIGAIRAAAEKLGTIKNMVAYGDFGLLAKIYGRDLQRELEQMQVHTRYVVNRHGKNSADMAIADDIYHELDHTAHFHTVLLGSGDRDFRPVVTTARKRNKKVVLLAFANSLSRELSAAADQVLYLDDVFDTLAPNAPLRLEPDAEQLTLVVGCAWLLMQERWQWVLKHTLADFAPKHTIEQAVDDKILLRLDRSSERRLTLNSKHCLVKAVHAFIPWFRKRFESLLQAPGANPIDPEQFFCAMRADTTLSALGIGQTSKNSQLWLVAADAANLGRRSKNSV